MLDGSLYQSCGVSFNPWSRPLFHSTPQNNAVKWQAQDMSFLDWYVAVHLMPLKRSEIKLVSFLSFFVSISEAGVDKSFHERGRNKQSVMEINTSGVNSPGSAKYTASKPLAANGASLSEQRVVLTRYCVLQPHGSFTKRIEVNFYRAYHGALRS